MYNEVTKNIPKLTKRENETLNRFKIYDECSAILLNFFEMGFKSFNGLKSIMQFYYPDIDEVQLKRFWNCVGMDQEIVDKVKIVFEKLKSE